MKKTSRYDDTEYMFSSARIRAMENRMPGREDCERFIDAGSSDEIIAMLGEFGGKTQKQKNAEGEKTDREAVLMNLLEQSFKEVKEMLPDAVTVEFLQYKYDCNNIKAALKCHARNINPDSMMCSAGTVDAAQVIKAVEDADYSVFPENMAAGAKEAAEAYLKTSDPQKIDLIMDRACFADVVSTVNKSSVPFSKELVSTEIDLINALMCIRVQRMTAGESGKALLSDALIDGGKLKTEFWLDLYDKGEKQLWETLSASGYSDFCRECNENSSLSQIEEASDRYKMSIIRKAKWLPFGAELSIAYLAGLEYAVKNVRIIMAGKDAGLDASVIRERMRDMYV